MPSERHVRSSTVGQFSQLDQQQAQVKVCAKCLATLADPASSVYLTDLDALVCNSCLDQLITARPSLLLLPDTRQPFLDINPSFQRQHEDSTPPPPRRIPGNIDASSPPIPQESARLLHQQPEPEPLEVLTDSYPSLKPPSPVVLHDFPPLPLENQLPLPSEPPIYSHAVTRRNPGNPPYPDPLADITRIRVRSQGHHCLYPGATFTGTQKSGRNSYDVNVTIVDVDFSSSFLCGYLRIRGLTDDWPELTTYFDAEIIGSRHGFLTQNWGANESEDMIHWSRFQAFRHVKHELRKPHLTMPDRDRGAVFMRWKERFLVPDHRVQDINGASFAGFYYVCVDFNPPAPSCTERTSQQGASRELVEEEISQSPTVKPEFSSRKRRDSSVRRGPRSPSAGPRQGPPVARMSGFYFHKKSEPYQQLTLDHVPERASSSFEFR
ncbi:hypothetical protein BDN72DRAFT_785047 [Pluteus cervinus]|uniref:Uncharacterized protein n=1 Tax=Pluteus cervinus TaxID=181527 RepID=A0ACD3BDR6_9AGAR|nr:hypothetical protein BDN72DRAFT_785047 [Pluteus cervinus]